jgi:hypothetical protein
MPVPLWRADDVWRGWGGELRRLSGSGSTELVEVSSKSCRSLRPPTAGFALLLRVTFPWRINVGRVPPSRDEPRFYIIRRR